MAGQNGGAGRSMEGKGKGQSTGMSVAMVFQASVHSITAASPTANLCSKGN